MWTPPEVASIVRAAAAARNGWKIILARCAPVRHPAARSAQPQALAGKPAELSFLNPPGAYARKCLFA